ncbi:MAG: cobalamin-dependent protein [Anaerolineaceae bacterium]|nr:cobalamin-dependent protein [Anaerolineaceae bacterium]
MNVIWEPDWKEFADLLLLGEPEPALEKTRQLLAEGITAVDFFQQCVTPAMVEVGNRFETLDIFLPEMVGAAEIVKRIDEEIIQPSLLLNGNDRAGVGAVGKVALASVQGDLHDIGKNMVALMLRANGFEVVDLGVNVSPSEIVERAEQEKVNIIGLSSLLTTCLPYMKDVIDYLKARGTREKFAVIIGGAAASEEFAKAIGADGQGHSAPEAVRICKEVMSSKRQQ